MNNTNTIDTIINIVRLVMSGVIEELDETIIAKPSDEESNTRIIEELIINKIKHKA